MLVEDEDEVRAILKQILEEQGYRVLAALNGEEALANSQNLKHDIKLMMTDVVMPQMSGPELAERVLSVRPNLPVLFMSGYTTTRSSLTVCWTRNSTSCKALRFRYGRTQGERGLDSRS